MNLVRVQAPVEMPVTVDDVKANSRVIGDHDDLLLTGLIGAALARAEMETGQAFAPQAWVLSLDSFPPREIVVPMGPIADHVEIEYRDGDGGTRLVAPDDYQVDAAARSARIVPVGAWPVAGDYLNAVRVRFEVGAECPEDVRQAILLMVGHWYERRETATEKSLAEMPYGAAMLLALHRRMFA